MDVERGGVGEGVEAVAAEEVERGAGEKVGRGVEVDGGGGDAGVGYGTVLRGMMGVWEFGCGRRWRGL